MTHTGLCPYPARGQSPLDLRKPLERLARNLFLAKAMLRHSLRWEFLQRRIHLIWDMFEDTLMKKLLILLFILSMLTGCGAEAVQTAPEAAPPRPAPVLPPEPEEPSGPEKTPAEVLLESMSLEEKVGQLFFVRCPGENAPEDVKKYHLGGYILFGRDTKDRTANDLIQAIASFQSAADIPLLIGVDEEGGTVVRVSSNPHLRAARFQNPRALWRSGTAAADAHEKDLLLKALGFNVNLAPVADVSTDPGDFIYERTTGEDAETAGQYVAQVVDMMCRDGMGSVLKHFPGYGGNVDTHTGVALDQRPLEQFRQTDFLPFQAGFAAGERAGGPMPAVLVSHNIMTALDPELPASLSPAVHALLRDQLHFDGVIMTDDLAMEAVQAYAGDGAAAVLALRAGNDLVLTTDYRTQIPKVLQAVADGDLDEALIDAACLRVLNWKIELGLI